jgi:hypothetical protein
VADDGTSPDDDCRTDLLDVGSMPFQKLILSDDTVLTNSLNRLLADIERASERYAAFGNAP